MKQLDFPSLINGISQVANTPTRDYLTDGGEPNIQEFIDSVPEAFRRIWRGGYQGNHIFTKGTGVGATYLLAFWLTQPSRKFHHSMDDYLEQVAVRYPLAQWESGTGALAHHKGGGAGRKIVDEIIGGMIVDLNEDAALYGPTKSYLSEHDRGLYNKLRVLFRPSSWKPLEVEFTDNEAAKGVYLIACLNESLNAVRIRIGQARDQALSERLGTHVSSLGRQMPHGFRPLFYTCTSLSESRITRAESALHHLVPPSVRLPSSAHPSEGCGLCENGVT